MQFQVLLTITASIAIFTSQAFAGDELFAPAEQGKIMCLSPDLAEKTCQGLATMAKQADGTYKSHSKYRFPQAPDYVYEYDDISFKKADLSCSVVKAETQKTAKFFRMGDEVLFEDLEQLRAFAAAASKPLEGKELCQKTKAIDAATGVIEFELNLDGQALPTNQQANSKLIWVDPKDGYKLR